MGRWRKVACITDDLPYTALVSRVALADDGTLPPDAGERFVEVVDEELAPGEDPREGRIALVPAPEQAETPSLLVVELDDWSVTIPLTTGQLHRLTNALAGRGTRSGIRPLSTTGEHVYLTGSPETLVVETRDRTLRIPAGPRRGLAKALRAYEESLKAA